MANQPLFSMVITAGSRVLRSQADQGSDNWIRLTNIVYVTKVNAWLKDDADWPDSGGTPLPLFLELCRDGAAVAAQTESPLWWMRVYQDDSTQTGREAQFPKNVENFFQPLECSSQLDVQFRHTAPYPGGTIFKPTDVEWTWMLEYFPLTWSGATE